MATQLERLQLLYCYANQPAATPDRTTPDKATRDEIDERLAMLRRGTVEVFDINHPPAGEQIEEWARLRIETADIIVLLISHHLVDSEHWDHHVPMALARFEAGAVKLIPVLVSEVNLDESPLAGRALLPGHRRSLESVESRSHAIRDVVAQITETAKRLVAAHRAVTHQFRPRRLLLAFANPRVPGQDTNIGVGAERERIRTALADAPLGAALVQSELWATDLARLVERIGAFKPDLIHIGMHIDANGDILFQDLDNRAVPTSPDALWEALSSCRHQARALVLNACHSALFSLACQSLFEHIIAMVGRVGDLGALDFSTGFYQSIAHGDHVRTAYWEGLTHERRLARTRRCTPVYLHSPRKPSA